MPRRYTSLRKVSQGRKLKTFLPWIGALNVVHGHRVLQKKLWHAGTTFGTGFPTITIKALYKQGQTSGAKRDHATTPGAKALK